VGILAITHVSNVTGEVVGIQNMVASIKHINPEIIVVADGAQAVAHMKVLVEDMGVDMYAFSGHKLYGPTGIGVLWVDKKLLSELEPVVFGGGMISSVDSTSSSWAVGVARYEAGTPPIAEAIGLGEAIEYVKKYVLVSETIETERKLLERLKTGLVELGCKVIEGKNSMSVVSFTVDGVHPHDVAEVLAEDNVCVRAGHHCAQPLHTKLGISESVRISLGIYNEEDDVRRLLAGIQKVTDIFKLHG
jgi:cysteine desulfurase/selenocysteine lyase